LKRIQIQPFWWKKSTKKNKNKISKKSHRQQSREIFTFPKNLKLGQVKYIVNQLQAKLAVALRSRETERIIASIRQITRSKICHAWAVYRTISSSGSRSPGYRDIPRPRTQETYNTLMHKIWLVVKKPLYYKAKPLRRIFFQKPNGGWRPISIPTYFDRAIQHLYLLILDVFQEETADQFSFGFRKFRSPGWAAKAITLAFWNRMNEKSGPPAFALLIDIEKCFDSIDHSFIMDNVTTFKMPNLPSIEIIPRVIVQQWLKQGFIDFEEKFGEKDTLFPTEKGVPQGGPISPIITNMVLNGLEEVLNSKKPSAPPTKNRATPNLVVPATCLTWFRYGKPVVSTFGESQFMEIEKTLTKTTSWDNPSNVVSPLLRRTSKTRFGWSFLKISGPPNLFEQYKIDLKLAYTKLLRFADDCVILTDSLSTNKRVLEDIQSFLLPRGLKLNSTKTITKVLPKETFTFAGFENGYKLNHGKWKPYNYPPISKVKGIIQKFKACLNIKESPYYNIRRANPILTGWLNFYRCGNSSKTFSYLRNRIFHIFRLYLYRFMARDKRFKGINGELDRTRLYQAMWETFLLRISPIKKSRWWGIKPRSNFDKTKGRYGENTFFLSHPKSVKIATPSIITGKSAYHPEDRIELEKKAIGWQWGLRGLIAKKSHGNCKLCACSIIDDEAYKWEIHHILPLEFGGSNILHNLIALCVPCHKSVTQAVRTRNTEQCDKFIFSNVLSPNVLTSPKWEIEKQ
jgi:retron-type reverse transcriptase